MTEYNLKELEYYCEKCKKFHMLATVNPSCPDCDRTMVRALRSLMDGSRITGNDELANTAFDPTRRIRKP